MMNFRIPFHAWIWTPNPRMVCLLVLILAYQLQNQLQNRFKEPAMSGSFLFELYFEESVQILRIGEIIRVLFFCNNN